MRIILASASPRRRELLELINVKPLEIIPARAPELPHPELTPAQLVRELSRAKASEVAEANPGALVIGADTVVAVDSTVLGKPADEHDARRMLALLSGREHEVFTGVAVIKDGAEQGFTERTAVRFRAMSAEEIAAYAATGESLDKAGAYGIQGLASQFIEGIDGDYFNVMGLPLCRLGLILKALGVKLL
ncbi:MAG: Maf family protein [Butyricicoccus sp.]|nr:Maf family protein [Butyricicoccus sp.]